MKNVRSTVLGILMIIAAVANVAVAVLDDDPETKPDFERVLTSLALASGGTVGILAREEKQHEDDKTRERT